MLPAGSFKNGMIPHTSTEHFAYEKIFDQSQAIRTIHSLKQKPTHEVGCFLFCAHFRVGIRHVAERIHKSRKTLYGVAHRAS